MRNNQFKELNDIISIKRCNSVTCPVCGGVFEYNPRTGRHGQWAHFICNTKQHIRRYGRKIIDSTFNGVKVCSLPCNNAVQLNRMSRPVLCDELAEWIDTQENIR